MSRPADSEARSPRRAAIVVCLMVVFALALATFGVVAFVGGSGVSNPATANCRAADFRVADPKAPHGLFVLSPPSQSKQPYYGDTAQYLWNNSLVCGANFWVHWNQIDAGPNASAQYNWSSVEQEMAPWAAAGKEVNLIFQTVGYGPSQSWIPSYVLPRIHTIQCGESPVTPLFWEPSYVGFYETFIHAAVAHFEGNPSIGYLRFGLGTGGEVFPLYGLQDSPACDAALNATGFTVAKWDSYLVSMLEFEHSLDPTVQLMVALNSVFPGIPDNVSSTVAGAAASLGIGFGSEGLEASQVHYNASGDPTCGGGSCRLFEEYSGEVPLEYQTYSASQPNGSGPTGSLSVMLPWAIGVHAQIFELYLVDWLTALDPNYPAYAAYHADYATAFASAAAVVDG